MAVFEVKFLARLCCYLKHDIARHGSNLCIWFKRKMLDLLILKLLLFCILDRMRNLPIIVYTKPPI